MNPVIDIRNLTAITKAGPVLRDVSLSVNAGEAMALVQAQGFAIIDVTTREADLEDVFVTLTSKAA